MNITQTLLLALPAFAANMAPIFAARYNLMQTLDKPVDGGRTWRGYRLTGDHKTWRGFAVGVGVAAIVGATESGLLPFTIWQSLAFGVLGGFGALVGDALESCIKRQLNIASGRPFVPFDQIDYILGFLLFTSFMYAWSWPEIIFLLCCGLVFNPIINCIGYVLGIKKTWW